MKICLAVTKLAKSNFETMAYAASFLRAFYDGKCAMNINFLGL